MRELLPLKRLVRTVAQIVTGDWNVKIVTKSDVFVAHKLQQFTTGPQKCDAEVLPLPGTDSTVQTPQRLEQK